MHTTARIQIRLIGIKITTPHVWHVIQILTFVVIVHMKSMSFLTVSKFKEHATDKTVQNLQFFLPLHISRLKLSPVLSWNFLKLVISSFYNLLWYSTIFVEVFIDIIFLCRVYNFMSLPLFRSIMFSGLTEQFNARHVNVGIISPLLFQNGQLLLWND